MGREEDISLTSSQGFLSHIFLHASAAEKVKCVARFEAASSVLSQFLIMGGVTMAVGGQIESMHSQLQVYNVERRDILQFYNFLTNTKQNTSKLL